MHLSLKRMLSKYPIQIKTKYLYLASFTASDDPVGETLSNAAIKCYFLFSNVK